MTGVPRMMVVYRLHTLPTSFCSPFLPGPHHTRSSATVSPMRMPMTSAHTVMSSVLPNPSRYTSHRSL